ncbi:MAG: P1 family peptidase, partial [candidate division NC10 bacterium]
MNATITAVAGLEAGHYTDLGNATGCTVIICRQGAVGGVDVRGGSPGTRETDLLRPGRRVDRVHAVVLSGGSAFGLDAASGGAGYLAELGIGIRIGPAVVPIVPAAILFDLGLVT